MKFNSCLYSTDMSWREVNLSVDVGNCFVFEVLHECFHEKGIYLPVKIVMKSFVLMRI